MDDDGGVQGMWMKIIYIKMCTVRVFFQPTMQMALTIIINNYIGSIENYK